MMKKVVPENLMTMNSNWLLRLKEFGIIIIKNGSLLGRTRRYTLM